MVRKSRAQIQRDYRQRIKDKRQARIYGTDKKSAIFYDLNQHKIISQSSENFVKENQPAPITPLKAEVVSRDPNPDDTLTYEKWLNLLDLLDRETLASDEWLSWKCHSCGRANSILQTFCRDCSTEMHEEAREHQELFLIKRPHLKVWRDWKDRDSLLIIKMKERSMRDNDN